MDYLRTLGSAAVSSLVAKSGLNLPFSLGPVVSTFGESAVWTLYEGTKRDDGSPVSVFEFNASGPGKQRLQPLAKNALRKLRTVRHPDVLKFLDAVETDSTIHIMTERVSPLSAALQDRSGKSQKEREDWLLWGLHRITVALAFVNDAAASTHGNVCVNSVFITPSGEWKLGGFELLSNPKDMNEAAVLYTQGSLLSDSGAHAPPEVQKSGWSVLKEHHPAVADAYALGLLLHTVFNPSSGPPATFTPPHSPPTPASRGAIPTSIFPSFKKLLNPSPRARMSTQAFLDLGMAAGGGPDAGFYANNPLVRVCQGLDNFALASDAEKNTFLRALGDSASSFPPEFASYRVLPSLVSALEYGGASAAAIIPLLLQLGKSVSPAEYPTLVLGPVLKLYGNPDRGIRMALLDNLGDYAEKLDKKMVNDKIWPHLQTGFSDTVAVIREATVKSLSSLAPLLSDRVTNNDLLRFLAKMQADPEASIRTNTCILIGRLAPSLSVTTRRKILVPAFSRALKDPFVHCRVAGLMAFTATTDLFEIEEVALKALPAISGSTIDKDKLVRDQAFKTIELFLKRLAAHAESMPETAAVEQDMPTIFGAVPLNGGPAGQATLAGSAAGAAGALAGWAYSSISKKLAATDLQTTMATSASIPATPDPSIANRPPILSTTLSSPDVTVPAAASQSRGLQLGATKKPASALAAALAAEVNAAGGGPDAWDDSDLMDVHADQGDWNDFESAPSYGTNPFEDIHLHRADNEWGTMDSPTSRAPPVEIDPWGEAPEPTYTMSASTTTAPKTTTPKKAAPAKPKSVSPAPKTASSPLSVPSPTISRVTSPTPSTGGMSKEDKATEMARRKEERKQRIAQLKEQKKTGAT